MGKVKRERRCREQGCTTRPSYGLTGSKERLFCSRHKHPDHVNIVSKRCQDPDCISHPAYGIPGTKDALYCSVHKHPDHINVVSKRCQEPGCVVISTYGIPATKARLYCSVHKHPDHINVVNKQCQETGCNTLPVYGIPWTNVALYCSVHKHTDHINVVSKRCQEPGCNTRPTYGIPGNSPTRCAQHKQNDMIPNPKKRCEHPKCKEIAVFGYRKQIHCEEHKLADEINLIHRTCVRCNLPDIVDERMICATCDPEVEKRVRLAKQKEIKDVFDASGLRYISYDRVIDNGWLGKERPDFLFDTETHFVIVEVDEEQHRNAACYCVGEQTRMVNISQILNGKTKQPKPVVFIRYNPDSYKPEKGRQVSNNNRKEKLKEWVAHFLKNKPIVFCSVIQLFFDGYEDGNVPSFTLLK